MEMVCKQALKEGRAIHQPSLTANDDEGLNSSSSRLEEQQQQQQQPQTAQ